MQAQDGPAEIFFKLWPTLEKNKNTLIGVGVAIFVGAGIWYVMSSQRAQSEVDAGLALTTLMTSPNAKTDGSGQMATQYQQLAAKYPGTAAGQRAEMQAAAALFDSGNFAEALTQFQKYLDARPNGPFAATAQIGIAASFEAQGKWDQAAGAYQRVVSVFPESVCVPQAQFSLGRIAEQQNKYTEAMNHYQDVLHSSSGGSLVQEANLRASDLKTKMDAAAPKPAASAAPGVAPGVKPPAAPATVSPTAAKP